MKKSYFFFLFTSLFFFDLEAQNYELFVSNNEYHYTRTIGQQDILFSIKMDSSALNGTSTNYYNYKQVSFSDNDYTNLNSEYSFPLYNQCLERKSWFSDYVEIDNLNEYTIHTNSYPITFKINTQIAEEWVFCQTGNRKYKAQVISNSEQTVLDALDSVKQIRINVYDLSNNPINNDVFNNKIILLSKNHGLLKAYSFLEFPNNISEYNLVGYENIGTMPLKEVEFYDFEIDDYIVYNNDYIYNKEYIIVDTKNTSLNSFDYNLMRLENNIIDSNYNFQYSFQPDNYNLTGQFGSINSENGNFIFINYIQNGEKFLKGFTTENPSSTCWPLNSYAQEYRKDIFYTDKIGLLKREENFIFIEYDEWGNEFSYYQTIDYKKLITYRSTQNLDYGINLSPYSEVNYGIDKQFSCDGSINFTLYNSGNWLDTISWLFGDGNSSPNSEVTHVYLNEGTYQPSLYLNSVFGDTLIMTQNYQAVFVGDTTWDNQIYINTVFNSCNERTFADLTENMDTRLWTLPDGSTSTQDTITYIFDQIDTFQITLFNSYAFCTNQKTYNIIISALESPIESSCPVSQSSSNLCYFKLNNIGIGSQEFLWTISSPSGDGFKFGCNQFQFDPETMVSAEIALIDYDLVETDPGTYEQVYYGLSHTLWIDYNNDGSFSGSENVFYHDGSNDWGGYYPFINSYENFQVSDSSIKNVPLRMRLARGTDPCDDYGYDFSVIITEEATSSVNELLNNQSNFAVYPNPTEGKINVQIPKAFKNKITFELKSLVGQRIIGKTKIVEDDLEIDLSSYSDGVYSLLIYENDVLIKNLKVIKD